jgi:hypothetical protein
MFKEDELDTYIPVNSPLDKWIVERFAELREVQGRKIDQLIVVMLKEHV